MTTDKIEDLLLKITSTLASMENKMESCLSQIANHEGRITTLEKHPSNQPKVKDNINKWLVIALIGCISVIVTLTGSVSVLKILIGN